MLSQLAHDCANLKMELALVSQRLHFLGKNFLIDNVALAANLLEVWYNFMFLRRDREAIDGHSLLGGSWETWGHKFAGRISLCPSLGKIEKVIFLLLFCLKIGILIEQLPLLKLNNAKSLF